jgi:hypothetical protein
MTSMSHRSISEREQRTPGAPTKNTIRRFELHVVSSANLFDPPGAPHADTFFLTAFIGEAYISTRFIVYIK